MVLRGEDARGKTAVVLGRRRRGRASAGPVALSGGIFASEVRECIKRHNKAYNKHTPETHETLGTVISRTLYAHVLSGFTLRGTVLTAL